MARHFYHDQPLRLRKAGSLFLAFFWILGLVSGIWVFLSADDFPISLMRGISNETVSIVCLLSFTALPFLLSIFMVFISKPSLILLLCFCKAFLFSYVSVSIFQCYGSAGWLIRLLLLFHDCAVMPILYLFWLRGLSDISFFHRLEAFFLLTLGILIGSIDYSIVSPVLAHMIDF